MPEQQSPDPKGHGWVQPQALGPGSPSHTLIQSPRWTDRPPWVPILLPCRFAFRPGKESPVIRSVLPVVPKGPSGGPSGGPSTMRGHTPGYSVSPSSGIVPPCPGVSVRGNPFHPCATCGLGVRRGSCQARMLGRGRRTWNRLGVARRVYTLSCFSLPRLVAEPLPLPVPQAPFELCFRQAARRVPLFLPLLICLPL